jgi:hypothetical protein
MFTAEILGDGTWFLGTHSGSDLLQTRGREEVGPASLKSST